LPNTLPLLVFAKFKKKSKKTNWIYFSELRFWKISRR